ncbi:hypothetical protein COV19_02075 [Candidatus Woesearchaeota archaeon CG10_big_fil_rev_8_21_14_0_10_44_13]|nr:MAG: hypothetical protein COV19_02075 [Candidatus Woesearchaeota archaeon CG10_big_fil_rev_8_21_14_0_10_44_13]
MFVLSIASAVVLAGPIDASSSTLYIKPEKNFTINDTAYLSVHVVSSNGPTPFTFSITLSGGVANITSIYISNVTGTSGGCDADNVCWFNKLVGFKILGAGPITFSGNLTDNSTVPPNSTIINTTNNGTVDVDGDSYPPGADCDDTNQDVHPGATEVCGNGLDDDCSNGDESCPSSPPSSGGGGHSGGGGRTAGGFLSTLNYDCTKGNISVGKSDKIIIEYNRVNYTFFVNDVLASAIQVKLYPIPSRDFTIEEGKNKEMDLDRNNRNDFTIRVDDVKLGKATVTCRKSTEIGAPVEEKKETIIEQVTEVASNVKEGILKIASEVVPNQKASPVVGSLIALAIVVAGLLIYFITRKGSDDEEDFD